MINTIIFDLDGTLTDTLEDLGDSMNRVLEYYGYPVHDYNAYRKFVGNGVPKLVERALGEHQDVYDEALKRFNDEYSKHCFDKTKPYDGILELLEKLEGYNLAVVTNKTHQFAVEVVQRYFGDTFKKVIGGGIYKTKPDPESCLKVCEEFQVTPDTVAYIGDSNVDMYTGKNLGAKLVIGCAWGFRGEEELLQAGADIIAYTPNDIYEAVR